MWKFVGRSSVSRFFQDSKVFRLLKRLMVQWFVVNWRYLDLVDLFIFCLIQTRRNLGSLVGGGVGGCSPLRFLLIPIFDELKKIVLQWKIVQNYKNSWNSSKSIDIYNIITDLNTRDDILSVMNSERFSSHF